LSCQQGDCTLPVTFPAHPARELPCKLLRRSPVAAPPLFASSGRSRSLGAALIREGV